MTTDSAFTGGVAEIYARHLVPLLFKPYATALANQLKVPAGGAVLEIAAGTGVVTRALSATLPPSVSITATDLNPDMLAEAAAVGTARPVVWRPADAMSLPFPDASFDAVVCQFGVMFFPDRAKAYAEARRVLRPGGVFLFDVWDRLEENEFSDTVAKAMLAMFPEHSPNFLQRTPYAYFDRATIERDLAAGGFTTPLRWTTLAARSRAASAHVAATAICQGTPLRAEINASGDRLAEATNVAAEAIAQRFGRGAVDGKIQAHIIEVTR